MDRFRFERGLLKNGILQIAGVDEAGRGPLAGPVVAAAVVLPLDWVEHGLPKPLRGLNDSKQLTPVERERFYEVLIHWPALSRGVTVIHAEVIDAINILQATHRAMNQALQQLSPAPQHVLVDGNHVPSLRFAQTALVRGDSRSYSIAAASVLAKVTRDRLMTEWDQQFPAYGFGEHKGYGTPQHLEALARHGPCPIHRRTFAPLRPVNLELFEF